jgi:hypothetical protein
VHAGPPCGAEEARNDAAHEVGADERNLLRDEATDREAEQIHPLEVHRLEERDGVVSHRLDRVRSHARRAANAAVVERDDAPHRCEIVDQSRIPVVEIPAEVLKQNERRLTLTEVAAGVLDSVLGRD